MSSTASFLERGVVGEAVADPMAMDMIRSTVFYLRSKGVTEREIIHAVRAASAAYKEMA